MAKRSRIGARPGQRRPLQRTATRPTTRPANAVTDEEMARAAELEAQILAEEEAAEEARKGRDRRAKVTPLAETGIYSSAPLAQRAAQEYGYVQRDLRRIAIVGGGLLLVLVLIDILFNVTHIL
jgi:hypothetical protein